MNAAYFRHFVRRLCAVGLFALCLGGMALPTTIQVSLSADEATQSEEDRDPSESEEIVSPPAEVVDATRRALKAETLWVAATPATRTNAAASRRPRAASLLASHNGCGATLRC